MDERIEELHREAPLVDVHAHPSLKAWLFDRDVQQEGHSTAFMNPFSDRTSLPKLRRGGVRVQWVTHHVPEQGLFEDSRLVRWAAGIMGLSSKLREGSPYDRLAEMMDQYTEQIESAGDDVIIASSPQELQTGLDQDRIVLLHAVEGGHVLENDLERVDELARRGVVSLTLTHFYPNGIAGHADAIPDSFLLDTLCSFDLFQGADDGLTDFGRDLLDRMVERGVIPDLTHTAPTARAQIYDHVPADFPLMATHVGLQEFCPDPVNLADDEIKELADRNGAVGLIFFNYFLAENESTGILESLWRSIEHVHDVTGRWDHVMIGTDFDGFTSPSDPLKDSARLDEFTRMLIDRGVPDDGIKKILGGNAMRIMRAVWEE